MSARRAPLIWAFVGFAVVIGYAWYLQPAWEPRNDDQVQYLALARGLADRAEYTRAFGGELFIPEPLRAPGYPLFLAALCRTAGCDHWRVALVQAVLVGATVLLVHGFARRFATEGVALAGAASVALYPSFGYFGALALSETLATVLLAFALVMCVRARESDSLPSAVACGLALGALALTRPVFAPLIVLVPVATLLARGLARHRFSLLIAIALTGLAMLVPFLAYTEAEFARPFTGNSGSQLWLGYFQGRAPVLDAFEREQADAGAREIASFAAVSDRRTQAYAFVALDDSLRARALTLVAHDPLGFIGRGAVRSLVLWAGDLPVAEREGAFPGLATFATVAQLVVLQLGLAGAIILARRGTVAGVLVIVLIVYVWAVSFPLWAEGRYSLPVKPFLLCAAVVAVDGIRRAAVRSSIPR